MKPLSAAVILAACCLPWRAVGQRPIDVFMGDWQGTVAMGGQSQNVSVYMIPLGEGRYEARAVADFQKRGPYLFRLKGAIRNAQFRFIDDIPLEAPNVAATTEQGVVFPASLWSGVAENGKAKGTIAGNKQGNFDLWQTPRVSPDLAKGPPEGAVVLSTARLWTRGNHVTAGKR
jgi:hypothetical protein